jgi:hypothetical protein
MKVTGFSFIRNAIKFDYPIAEAIRSILPICNEFVIAVGESEDETLELIRSIHPYKIRIIETKWDDMQREGGKVLADETMKAYNAISDDTDWCFYIQGDEAVHENDLKAIQEGMMAWKDDKEIDGLLFRYKHFYGSYNYIGTSSRWYDKEVRVVRKDKAIYAYRDAQGFRKGNNKKLYVKPVNASIYHYGWVKPPETMQLKQEHFHKLWHSDEWVNDNIVQADEFDYHAHIDSLRHFTGAHPKIMQERIKARSWKFNYDLSFNKISTKDKLKIIAKRKLAVDFNYRNYILETPFYKKIRTS